MTPGAVYMRARNAKHPGRRNQQRQAFRAANLAQVREKDRLRYWTHHDAMLTKNRKSAAKLTSAQKKARNSQSAARRDPAAVKANRLRWYHKHREQVDRYRIQVRYGLGPEQLAALVEQQCNCCALCDTPFTTKGGAKRHIDHNHTTNVVRGLLCHRCNIRLEVIEHSPPAWLIRAAAYLQRGT